MMKKISLFLAFMALTVSLFAIPARRTPITVEQPDGTTLTVLLNGDEHFHYYSTLDGLPLMRDKSGAYYYAKVSSADTFVSTGVLAHNAEERTAEEKTIADDNLKYNLPATINRIAAARSARKTAPATRVGSDINPEGNVRVPVLLVEYSDVKFTSNKEFIQRYLNEEGFNDYKLPYDGISLEGSLRDYFVEQSGGKFRPTFEVLGVVTLPKNRAYYGGNDTNDSDKNPAKMISDALKLLDSSVDFSMFDNDGDGEIEFVYCLYAGHGEHAGAPDEAIWPHQWYLSGANEVVTVDGKKADTYACSSELNYGSAQNGVNWLTGYGTICHEFSHCLGLPDFYDTSSNSTPNFGMDYWDLMDQGCYNVDGYIPIGYSAYELDFLGWRQLVTLTEAGTYTLKPISQGGVGYKVVNKANSNEYYVLENRQQEHWDSYIFNHGMLITHVDYDANYWYRNAVNNTKNHERFTIIPADGERMNYYTAPSTNAYTNNLKGDTWPGTSGNRALADNTKPAAEVYKGGYMGKPITEITEAKDGTITFSFSPANYTAPTGLKATPTSENSFVASWNEVKGASGYIVTLEREIPVGDGSGIVENILIDDFAGCTSLNEAIINPDKVLSVEGWSVNNVYSEMGMLRIGSAANEGDATTPLLEQTGPVKISFDYKLYNKNDTGVKLTLTINSGHETIKTTFDEVVSNWNTFEETYLLDAPFTVTLSTANSTNKKRVSIDNLSITGNASSIIEHVETVETTEASYEFKDLQPVNHRFTVALRNDKSLVSDWCYAYLLTDVEDVVVEENGLVEIYALSGVCVYKGAADEAPALAKGIYIVRSAEGTRKYVIE